MKHGELERDVAKMAKAVDKGLVTCLAVVLLRGGPEAPVEGTIRL
jgi:hypothetical protein